jgi:hypothetical protein
MYSRASLSELILPEPVGKQTEWLDADRTRKLLRVGRRGSKTRFAFIAAMTGHGPGWDHSAPKLKGVLQGGDVVWIAQNYTNLSTVLWREEIVPRMLHLPWIELNVQRHDIEIPGVGALLLRSADRDAIASIRGIGKRLNGVIVDEAAWLDLRGALLDVILPALADNDGWLIVMSTTNAGTDGGYDETGAPQIPSYFNLLCEEVRAGKRSEEWAEFYATAFDNPTMSKKAIEELIAEYPPDSPKLKQEVYAELLRAGVGLALPEVTADRHILTYHHGPRFRLPSHWTQFGGFDWGFNHPWVFGWYAGDEDGNIIKLDTLWGRHDLPDMIAQKIIQACPSVRSKGFIIHGGHDIFEKKGASVGFSGPTIEEALSAHGLLMTRANTNRVLGLNNLRSYLHWEPSWPIEGPEARRPRLTFLDTEGNRRCLAQLAAMPLDPLDLEDAMKVDADAAGRGGDDAYDETRYAMMSRPLFAEPPEVLIDERRSLGYDYDEQRPFQRLSGEEWMDRLFHRASPLGAHATTSTRYRVPFRRHGR